MNEPLTWTWARTLLLATATLTVGCLGEDRTVTREATEIEAAGVEALELEVGAGRLDVIGEPGRESIAMEVELRTNRLDTSVDADAEAALSFTLEDGGDGRASAVVRLGDAPVGYWADVVLRVPARLDVAGVDGSGDALVEGVASLELIDDSGDLRVERVPGAVRIDDESGELLLEDVGPTTLRDGSGGVRAIGVRGDLTLTDDSGEVWIEDVDGDVSLDLGSGDARCVGVRGDVTVQDGSGDLWFEDVDGEVRIDDGSGDIVAVDVGALVLLSDDSGTVDTR